MTLNDALNQILDEGIEGARADYAKPADKLKLEGSVLGFEECRGKTPEEIKELLAAASAKCREARDEQSPQYWFWRCRESEIEWTANVLSCIMQAEGLAPIASTTARGYIKAAIIFGLDEKALYP